MDQMVTNFAVYEDATEYLGLAEVEFPEIGFLTEEISAAGENRGDCDRAPGSNDSDI